MWFPCSWEVKDALKATNGRSRAFLGQKSTGATLYGSSVNFASSRGIQGLQNTSRYDTTKRVQDVNLWPFEPKVLGISKGDNRTGDAGFG